MVWQSDRKSNKTIKTVPLISSINYSLITILIPDMTGYNEHWTTNQHFSDAETDISVKIKMKTLKRDYSNMFEQSS